MAVAENGPTGLVGRGTLGLEAEEEAEWHRGRVDRQEAADLAAA